MPTAATTRDRSARPALEALEGRNLPAVTTSLAAGVLTIQGDAARDNVLVQLDTATNQLVVRYFAAEVARFDSAAVTTIAINGAGGDDALRVDNNVLQTTIINGGDGNDVLKAGGGTATLNGMAGRDKLTGGPGPTTYNGDGGPNVLVGVQPTDAVAPGPNDRLISALPPVASAAAAAPLLTASEVELLLTRASAASSSNDAIIAIVDRNGRLLGLRVEAGVNPAITNNNNALVFAVDGALAKARTAAFFANNGAPLTSRTVQFISQTTITQREVESYPSIPDANSDLRGPGFVAPVGIKGHFPPNVPFTPQVDLFAIEHTNRDSILHPGADGLKGTADDQLLRGRFDIDPAFVPDGQGLFPPESYGRISGLQPDAQSRGIATLPGGIPLFKDGTLVGGIGVFFPGRTGFATEENSSLSATFDPTKPDRSLEAEFIAFAAAGGSSGANASIGEINGVPALPGFDLPNGRIDLVGITLDIFGPEGTKGPEILLRVGATLGVGVNNGTNLPVDLMGTQFRDGLPVPEGWLVLPHSGDGVTAAEVEQIITQGFFQAQQTRAAIRLPFNTPTAMVFAVADRQGEIVGLYRMPDATVFSIDVAVAKARNVAYYANPDQLQAIDQVPGAPPGFALTNRSIRYLALPRFPEGIDGKPPGPYSILNDGGTDPTTGLQVGPRLPASAFQSVQGHDAFFPNTNFHDPFNVRKQNGVVFFPGSSALYRNSNLLIGGFGVSGDGVDQDDVVTSQGALGFEPVQAIRIDQVFVRGVRIPYIKFNRNPEGGIG